MRRGFFASLELAETWNKQFSLTSMDDAFKDAAGGNPGDVSVQSITVGRRRGWVYLLYLGQSSGKMNSQLLPS